MIKDGDWYHIVSLDGYIQTILVITVMGTLRKTFDKIWRSVVEHKRPGMLNAWQESLAKGGGRK